MTKNTMCLWCGGHNGKCKKGAKCTEMAKLMAAVCEKVETWKVFHVMHVYGGATGLKILARELGIKCALILVLIASSCASIPEKRLVPPQGRSEAQIEQEISMCSYNSVSRSLAVANAKYYGCLTQLGYGVTYVEAE